MVSPNIDRIALTDLSLVSANIPSTVPSISVPSIQAELENKIRMLEEKQDNEINKNKTELDKKIREQDKKIHKQEEKILDLQKKIETLMKPSHLQELLGERLFQLIRDVNPTLPDKITGKITSNLLDNDNTDILFMLENKGYLQEKVQDCLKFLISSQ